MIITVGGLSQGRTTARSQDRPEQLGFDKQELDFLQPVDVLAEITRMGFDVYVDCTIDTAVKLECCRCLDKFRFDMKIRWKMLFVPARHRDKGSTTESGVFLYREFIDLGERICEVIREELPMKPLCSNDCRGLCSQCGVNLNEDDCNCEVQDESYHPFKNLDL